MADGITFDAEALELRLPEDRRIQVKTPRELERIAGILRKPILCETVTNDTGVTDPSSTEKGSCMLAVYDGLWVYYCEVQAKTTDREESSK